MSIQNVFPNLFHPRNRARFLGLSLIALLFALHKETSSALGTICIFLHFSLALIWQPLWHSTTPLSARSAAVLVACISGLLLWPGWLIITVWLVIIIGLLGGESAGTRRNQLPQLIAMSSLFITLLLIVVPLLLNVTLGNTLLEAIAFGAAFVLAGVLIFIPVRQSPRVNHQIDYLRAISITFLALLLASGSALWMYRAQILYSEALFQTMISIAILIIVANWLWSSQSGHSMIQTLWNRYLLNLGTPFEQYLIFLSESAQRHTTPQTFLDAALQKLLSLDWVTGVSWWDNATRIELGEPSLFKTQVSGSDSEVTIYSQNDVGPSFVLHIQLLVHLIEHFYSALQREAQLETHLRMEAIHETGSRLTHDIKNLLQSMHYLAAVVEASKPEQAQESLKLLQKQFPELRQRMQATLEKMKKPGEFDSGMISSVQWWKAIRSRYDDPSITFTTHEAVEGSIPKDLFDNVAENLLTNARYKQQSDRSIVIDAQFMSSADSTRFSVHDTGPPIPEETARRLFRESVHSDQGLGVGLYQSAQLAQRHGYELSVFQNDESGVGIELNKQ
ncbi:MAG: HAMP domain-containing sensor histidine kinase [Pseudomonadota bacterium]